MELFKNTNFDFLRYKWPFILASVVLSVAGIGSMLAKGGPRYGIEFKGGMLMTVKFQNTPPIEKVRTSLSAVLANPPSVQTFENGSNEIVIGTEGADDKTLASNRQLVVDTLAKTFGEPGNGKLDLNNASAGQLANRLRDPLQKAGVQMSDQQVDQLAVAMMAWRDQRGGLVPAVGALSAVPGVTPQVVTVLNAETYASQYTASRNIEIVLRNEKMAKRIADLHEQTWTSSFAAPIDIAREYPKPAKAAAAK